MVFRKLKLIPVILLVSIFFIGLGKSHLTAGNSDAQTVKVNPFIKVSDWEGWGTSLCWFANVIGGWPEKNRNALEDLMFDKDKGLGLNIARYNIGGGENPEHVHMAMAQEMPGFEPSEGVYDWTADENQRIVLNEAIARGVNITEAFSNSPPYWMTKSQCAGGAEDGGNNLKDEYYNDFADYLTEVVKHYKDNWGITFNSLAPMNEPSGTWWVANKWQEGCSFDHNKQNELIKQVSKKMKEKGLNSTIISAADDFSCSDQLKDISSWDNDTLNCVSRINVHEYGEPYVSELTDKVMAYKKKFWMDEFGTDGKSSDCNSITAGLTLANKINDSLKFSGVSAWLYWQAIENNENGNTWGLIHTDFTKDGSSYNLGSQYYALANYAKFIRPGYTIINAEDENTVAAYSKKDRRLVLVRYNNQADDCKVNYDLSKFEKLGYNVQVYRTSATENFKKLNDLGFPGKTLSVVSKGNSITTYVISIAVDSSNAAWSKAKEVLKDSIVVGAGKDYILRNGMNLALDTYSNFFPEKKGSKLYVPIDLLLQKFGGTPVKGYNYDDKKIKISIKGQKTVEYTAGSRTMVVNGKKVNMTLAPKIEDKSEMCVELDSFIKSVAGMKLLYSGDMAIIYDAGKTLDAKKDKAAIGYIKKIYV